MFADHTPDTIIIQGGCNDVFNKNSSLKDIAKATGSLGNLCCSHGVNQVLISSLICQKKFSLNNKVKQVNFLLKTICDGNDFIFIKNDNIVTEDLKKDGIHFLIEENPH